VWFSSPSATVCHIVVQTLKFNRTALTVDTRKSSFLNEQNDRPHDDHKPHWYNDAVDHGRGGGCVPYRPLLEALWAASKCEESAKQRTMATRRRRRLVLLKILVSSFVVSVVVAVARCLVKNSIAVHYVSNEQYHLLTYMTINSTSRRGMTLKKNTTTRDDHLKQVKAGEENNNEPEDDDWMPDANLFSECLARNRVIGRFFMSKVPNPYPEERPYSMRIQDFQRHHADHHHGADAVSVRKRTCSTLQ
jgi:hypothetical protein